MAFLKNMTVNSYTVTILYSVCICMFLVCSTSCLVTALGMGWDVHTYEVNCYKCAVGMTGILCTCMINSSQLHPVEVQFECCAHASNEGKL